MAKDYVKRNTDGLTNNKYFDFLVKFGFSDNIFDMDPSITSIHFKDREIPRLPNLDRFTDLEEFVMINNKLSEIHESIGKLKSLHMLILPKNNLRVIPKEIGLLKI
jgi:Leucine-rich repeat (LRR) protein